MATHADRDSPRPLQRPSRGWSCSVAASSCNCCSTTWTPWSKTTAPCTRASPLAARYDAQLGSLYAELDAVEGELHAATRVLAEALQRQACYRRPCSRRRLAPSPPGRP